MIVAMTGGTMFAIWLGELISEYGIRNQGLSLIIFAGIVSRIPSNLLTILSDEQNRGGSMTAFLVIVVLTVFAIVFVQQGRRNVPVMYPGRRMGNRQCMPVRGNLPLQGEHGRHDPGHLCPVDPDLPGHHRSVLRGLGQHDRQECRHSGLQPIWRPERLVLAVVLCHGGGLYLLLH